MKRLALFLLGLGSLVAVSVNAANSYNSAQEQEPVATEQVCAPVTCNPDTVCGPDICTPAPCATDTVCVPTPENAVPCATPVAQAPAPGCC